jgi:diguanylate cyclase (GGDEF)-like protein
MSGTKPSAAGLAALSEEGTSARVIVRCFAEALDAAEAMLVFRTEPPVEVRSGEGPSAGLDRLRDHFLPRLSGDHGAVLDLAGPNGGGEAGDSAVGASILTANGIRGAIAARFPGRPELPAQHCVSLARSYAATAALCANPLDGISLALGASRVDSLTGCLDLAALIDVLEAEIARSERLARHLSCCFIDLDRFKAVNDTEGHLPANDVLARAGNLLKSGARRYDQVARFGGDEFVVILPETAAREARKLAERLCHRLTSGLASMTTVPLTASAGVAEWQPGAPAAQLLEAADSALRAAKAFGGSRVAVDPASMEVGAVEPLEVATGMVRERYNLSLRPELPKRSR